MHESPLWGEMDKGDWRKHKFAPPLVYHVLNSCQAKNVVSFALGLTMGCRCTEWLLQSPCLERQSDRAANQQEGFCKNHAIGNLSEERSHREA